jgi:hypothetical protein
VQVELARQQLQVLVAKGRHWAAVNSLPQNAEIKQEFIKRGYIEE